MKIAFIGLGKMGYPMAGHLAQAGHTVSVFNRTPEKAHSWAQRFGGRIGNTPAEAAHNAELICLCVGNDADVRQVVLGDNGVLAAVLENRKTILAAKHDTNPNHVPKTYLVDHTTTSAKLARELHAALAPHDVEFIDAPVSGGQVGAEKGILTVMCGGEHAAFLHVMDVLRSYGQAVTYVGTSGCGQLAKMVNQICIAGLLQGLAEGIRFGQNAKLDMPLVLDVISKGAAMSWQMVNRGQTMVKDEFNFGFAVDWMRKDLGLCLDEAARNQSSLPITELVNSFYGEIQQQGGRQWDTSSLITRLPKKTSENPVLTQ